MPDASPWRWPLGCRARGYHPDELSTEAAVTLEPEGQGFRISRSALTLRAKVPNLDEATSLGWRRRREELPGLQGPQRRDHIGRQVDLRRQPAPSMLRHLEPRTHQVRCRHGSFASCRSPSALVRTIGTLAGELTEAGHADSCFSSAGCLVPSAGELSTRQFEICLRQARRCPRRNRRVHSIIDRRYAVVPAT